MTISLYCSFISGKFEDDFGNGWTACDWTASTKQSMIHWQQPEQQNGHWSIDDKKLSKQMKPPKAFYMDLYASYFLNKGLYGNSKLSGFI